MRAPASCANEGGNNAVGGPPTVSVVIPTRNGGAAFRACLEAVHRQELEEDYEVICIDSGSTDDTLRHCREFGVRVIGIDPRTFNHGLTRNHAIAAARGEFVALLTQDAVPLGNDWLHWLVTALKSTPRAAGAYGRQVMRENVNPYLRWRLEAWAATRSEPAVQEIRDRAAFEAAPPLEKLALVSFDNVNSCIRKSVWSEMPFSAVAFGEDIDWSLRVMQAGHAIVYEPRARVLHSHNDSLWRDFKRIYLDHRHLNRLLGMRQIPTFGDLVRSLIRGLALVWREVDLDDQHALARFYWRLYAIAWVLGQNSGQYLGAKASERGSRAPWRWIDAFVRRY